MPRGVREEGPKREDLTPPPDYEALEDAAHIPEFEGDRGQLRRAKQQEQDEQAKLKCPACQSLMVIAERSTYKTDRQVTADYVKIECRECGFVIHSYEPSSRSWIDLTSSIPF